MPECLLHGLTRSSYSLTGQKITLVLIFYFLLACWRGRASCWCFKCSHRVARQCPGCRKDSVWEPTCPTHLLHRVLCRGQGNTSTTKTYLACLYVCCAVRHWLRLQKICLQSFCMNYIHVHVWYCREKNLKKNEKIIDYKKQHSQPPRASLWTFIEFRAFVHKCFLINFLQPTMHSFKQ